MNIASVTASDVTLLATLHSRCFRQAWDARAFAELLALDNISAFVAHEERRPAGFILSRVAADEAEILTIGVLPEDRRQGLARELVLQASQQVFGCGARALFLEVSANNVGALSLYRQLGFEEVGRRSGYYRSCEWVADALVLRRVLPIPAWEST